MTLSMPGSVLWDVHQAAAYLGISADQLRHLRYRGEGPKFVAISRRTTRYRQADLDEYIVGVVRDPERVARARLAEEIAAANDDPDALRPRPRAVVSR